MIIDARYLGSNQNNANKQSAADTAQKQQLNKLIFDLQESPAETVYNIKDTSAVQLPTLEETRAAKSDMFDPGLDVSKIERIELKNVYESDYYDANKALSYTWLASSKNSSICISDSGSKVSDEAVKGMSKSDFLDYVRKNGLDKEIHWDALEMHLNGTKSYDNFSEFTNYTAAFFAGLESRIKSDFSGEEQKAQLEQMNGLYEKAVDDFIGQYKELTDKAFGELGAEFSDETLAASIRRVIDTKKDDYSEFIRFNPDYAEIKDTEDSWLKREVGFMTNSLINAFSPDSVKASDDLWSEDEIIAVGLAAQTFAYEKEFGAISKACQLLGHKDEEYVGLNIAMSWLTAEKITVELNVSDKVKGLIGGLLEKYTQQYIDDVNYALDKARNNPLGAHASNFTRLDEKAVYNVLDVMKKTYNESGDFEKAIYTTAKFAHDTVMSKLQKNEYAQLWRYNKPLPDAIDAKSFWGSFYDTDSKNKYGNGMGKLIKKWNAFSDIMAKRDWKNYSSNGGFNMFTGYANKSTFKGPIFGGYSNGKWWGTNLEEYVKSSR